MGIYKNTPGVQIEEIAKLPPSIAEVETAIPAFIGYTQMSNRDENDFTIFPVRITSLLEYETIFGTTENETIVVDATDTLDIHGNLISRSITTNVTAPVHTMYYHMQMYFANGGGPCYIVSLGKISENAGSVLSPDIADGLQAVSQHDEPTLLVIPECTQLGAAPATAIYKMALQQCASLEDRFLIMDCCDNNPDSIRLADSFDADSLKYGAAYHPYLETSLHYVCDEAAVTVRKHTIGSGGGTVTLLLPDLAEADNSLYHLIKQSVAEQYVTLPPSAVMAGVYARVDSTRGVWKAPANVGLNMIRNVTQRITDQEQETLNVVPSGRSVNAIRTFAGKGTIVWGARTLDGNSSDWRYIAVRRFFNMVEESTKNAVEAFVFEPNDTATWQRVQGMIENYLTVLWRAGALQGAKAKDAFYVNVGLGKTMTVQDVLDGRMYIEVGMAVVRPAEFIVLNFSHIMSNTF